jgi:DNA-binding transcriptional regulator YhcF (GntR family)
MRNVLSDIIDSFFLQSKALKLKLLNYIIEHPLEKIPTSNEIAETYDISSITVKKIVTELVGEGYLRSNKKAGTKATDHFSKAQKHMYAKIKQDIKKHIQEMEDGGLTLQEILACLYGSISEYSFDAAEIIYTEKDSEMVFVGASELSERLNTKIKPVYFENIQKEIASSHQKPTAIIVPFYCLNFIRELSYDIKILPIQTTHPLESLSSSKSIAYNSNVMYVAISEDDKEGAFSLSKKITQGAFNLKINKIEDVVKNPLLLNSIELVVTYKWVINNNEHIFRNVPKIIAYNRFDDKEGLMLIKHFIESNKLKGG